MSNRRRKIGLDRDIKTKANKELHSPGVSTQTGKRRHASKNTVKYSSKTSCAKNEMGLHIANG